MLVGVRAHEQLLYVMEIKHAKTNLQLLSQRTRPQSKWRHSVVVSDIIVPQQFIVKYFTNNSVFSLEMNFSELFHFNHIFVGIFMFFIIYEL
jgi:hypothetical protein